MTSQREILSYNTELTDRLQLSLNIYCEEKYYGGDLKNETYFYKEIGVSEDAYIYKTILDGLLEAIKASNITLQK